MKVYGGRYHLRGKSLRAVVAANNQREVANVTGVSLHEIQVYWCVTGNQAEIEAAMTRPRTLLLIRQEYSDTPEFETVQDVTGR